VKLYIWCEPYAVEYGSSVCFAVAKSEEEARKLLAANRTRYYGGFYEEDEDDCWKLPNLGPPSRVVELPHAEHWYWRSNG